MRTASRITALLLVCSLAACSEEPGEAPGEDGGATPDGGGTRDGGGTPDGGGDGGLPNNGGTDGGTNGGPILFKSDWRTSTGRTDTALRDTIQQRPWTEHNDYAGAGLLDVVSATGLGFPTGMQNTLRVLQRGESAAGDLQVTDYIATPGAGTHLYYRVYTRVSEAASNGAYDHPIELRPGTCATTWTYKRQVTATGWRVEWVFNTPGHTWYDQRGPELAKDVVYRIEWHVHIDSASTFRFDTRIYDASGNLVLDDDDFDNTDTGGGTLASRDPAFALGDASCFRSFFLGNNGQAGWPNTGTYTYYGGVKICGDTWCGPYRPGE